MRTPTVLTLMPLLLLAACSEKVCTSELRGAVSVTIVSNGLMVDAVTAHLRSEAPCQRFGASDAGASEPYYVCWEQGAGTYVVQVTSGSLTWTENVVVAEDEDGCHVREGVPLTVVLDPDTAD